MEKSSSKKDNFSLAGTFPHTIRWGMKKPGPSDPKLVRSPEKGETERAPQVDEAEAQGDSLPRRDPAEGKRDPRDPRPDAEGYCEFTTTITTNPVPTQETDTPFPSSPVDSEVSTLHNIRESPTADDPSPPDDDDTTAIQHRTVSHIDSHGRRRGTLAHEYLADPAVAEGLNDGDRPFNYWALIRLHLQRPLAEWLGTTVLMFLGVCGNLSVITSESQTGTMQSQYWCWGFAVMLAIYIAGGGSGAFLNPALTLMLAIFRGFPAKRVPVYVFVQLLGAFTGASLAFLVYRDDIMHLDGALIPESTGLAFYTQPKDWVSNSTAFFTELLGTAIIGCSILALGDSHNSPPGSSFPIPPIDI
jgi:aquaglyceroporin related protein